jgi:protein CMS1
LSSAQLVRIVVDLSHIDQKRRGILDMRETLQPLMRLLNRPDFRERYGLGDSGLKLLFY